MGGRFQEEKAVKCVICKKAETENGTTTVTLERNASTVIVRGVPAQVCTNCGEAYVNEEVGKRLLDAIEVSVSTGVDVAIRQYVAA